MNQLTDQEGSDIDQVSPPEDETENRQQPALFPVSEGKLLTLYLLSFGLYGVYWFYKNWQLQQPSMDKKIYPILRAIFSIFFTHSLFNRIDKQASQLENRHKFNASLMATFYVAAIVISHIIDQLAGWGDTSSEARHGMLEMVPGSMLIIISIGLFLISAYPLLKVQATANRINDDMLGYLNHRYTLWNYLLIATGAIVWVMLGLGLLAESMGLTEL